MGRLTLRWGDGNRVFKKIQEWWCEFKGLRGRCKIPIIRVRVEKCEIDFGGGDKLVVAVGCDVGCLGGAGEGVGRCGGRGGGCSIRRVVSCMEVQPSTGMEV